VGKPLLPGDCRHRQRHAERAKRAGIHPSAGFLRPYAGVGLPLFFFTDDMNNAQVAVGGRLAGGLELVINGHFSIEGELGIEHYFNVAGVLYKGQSFEETAFAPTLGVIGRL